MGCSCHVLPLPNINVVSPWRSASHRLLHALFYWARRNFESIFELDLNLSFSAFALPHSVFIVIRFECWLGHLGSRAWLHA